MSKPAVLALDQGTTSSRAIVFGREGLPLSTSQIEFEQIYPRPGDVEHDPEAIWSTQLQTAREAITRANVPKISAIGITNQRETTVLWDRVTGKPVANAIVWQSRVSAYVCERLKAEGHEPLFRRKTGLVMDAYFSGTKIAHLLATVDGLRARALKGDILFGTVDSFLIWRLTGGRVHVTDVSNASRTLLMDLETLEWDDELLKIMGVPRTMLPKIVDSSGIVGETDEALFGSRIPIAGIAGDQQAATFGQCCFKPGDTKNTYGTGCFLLMNTGSTPKASGNGLLTTVGWRVGGKTTYGLEGSVFIAGAVVQWLRDSLQIIATSGEVETLAGSVEDSGGVYMVPAFVGLGAPYWDSSARGAIFGLTRGTTRAHIARAAVDSIAYQSRDVIEAMRKDSGLSLETIRVDGGATRNGALLQFQADILGARVLRPVVAETTALGAAYLAGLATGVWADQDDIQKLWALDRTFTPSMDAAKRESLYAGWTDAVSRTRSR
ncbi:MAG TPA: glycerol kinase GlpK [Vicinamibacteria bacterium]|nr:glycerol kinase GlpK [Vicinamibacteria bacterium]